MEDVKEWMQHQQQQKRVGFFYYSCSKFLPKIIIAVGSADNPPIIDNSGGALDCTGALDSTPCFVWREIKENPILITLLFQFRWNFTDFSQVHRPQFIFAIIRLDSWLLYRQLLCNRALCWCSTGLWRPVAVNFLDWLDVAAAEVLGFNVCKGGSVRLALNFRVKWWKESTQAAALPIGKKWVEIYRK